MFQSARCNYVVMFSLFLVALLVGSMNVNAAVSNDNDVKKVQQSLRDKGYSPGPIDGVMGAQTREALRKYQRDQSLPVTGRLDSETAQRFGVAPRTRDADLMKIRGMDTNNDGVITRAEYRGDDRSFANHDWNGDGVLSGDELRPGAQRPDRQVKGKSAGGEFNQAGKDMGSGSKEAAHEMKKGKPVASGKEFGKGVGRFGESVGKGVKKAVSPESDRGDREKKEKPESEKQPQ